MTCVFFCKNHSRIKDAADFEKDSGSTRQKIVAFADDLSETPLEVSERLKVKEKENVEVSEQLTVLYKEGGGVIGSSTSSLTSCSNESNYQEVFLTYKESTSAVTRGKDSCASMLHVVQLAGGEIM